MTNKNMEMARTMAVDALPGERVMGELSKALLTAERPSVFFEELQKMDQLGEWFPELAALIGVPQNPAFHPEGDVWTHTMQVLDEAARLRDRAEKPLWFMLSALCHDMGKPAVTEERNGVLYAYAHEAAGLPVVRSLLRRLTREVKLTQYVLNMTELHMEPNAKVGRGSHVKSFMKMFDRSLCPEDLLLLAKADYLGRQGPDAERETLLTSYAETECKLRDMLLVFKERMERPCLMGRDLIAAGCKPCPAFTEALAYAHKLRLAGIEKDEQLRHTLAYIRKHERRPIAEKMGGM